ncbi:MAG: CRTAC1 family protein [Elusimicrobiota bacterium]
MKRPKLNRYLGPLVLVAVLGPGIVLQRLRYPDPEPPPESPATPMEAEEPFPAGESPPPEAPAAEPPTPLPFELVDATAETGLTFHHQKATLHPSIRHINPWLASVGIGVSVVDFDMDGWYDVYVTNMAVGSRNVLFRNNGDGTFTDVAEKAGLARVNQDRFSMRPLFFDMDNDGFKDLLLLQHPHTAVYRNNGDGTFSDVTEDAGIDHSGPSYSSNAIDFDGDGDLDVVIGDYFPKINFMDPHTTKFMMNSIVSADNGGEISVYRNDGKGRFSRVSGDLGFAEQAWTQAVGVYDFNGDGRPDVYFATDYAGDRVYLNEGDDRFLDISDTVKHQYSLNGMNADVADIDNDGQPSVFVTTMYHPPYMFGRNTLWKWVGGKTYFRNRAREHQITTCGWAWGGKFLDLDNDSLLDLVVTNGYISADPKKNYWYRMGVLAGAARDVLEDARNWPPMEDATMAGYQRKCLYHNQGGVFKLVTHRTAMKDDVSDGRAIAAIDYLNDGSLSFVEGNQGQPLRFYRTLQKNRNRWIGFKLIGTKGNRDAWGAQVTVKLSDRTLTSQNQPANAFVSQSDDRMHFGLGPKPKIRKVEIRWPGGAVQVLKKPTLDRYHTIKEPA